MKRLLFGVLAVSALVMTSCSKEAKINKRLDGSWNATMIDNETPASGESMTVTFAKDKKDNGTGTSTYTNGSFSISTTFTYTLSEDKMTTITTIPGSTTTETDVVTITKYEKDRIEWTNSDNEKTILEAK